ncbi:MAG: hypothetical protein AAEC86_11795 [Pseudohongiellaceae bacterium]|jgi:hypothetical protein
MKNVVTKIAAAVFMAASIIHLLNFFIGSVISVGGYIIPSNISLVVTFILWWLAFKLITLR